MAYSLPKQLARHMQGVLFQTDPASELTVVRSAYHLGKWRQSQPKPRAVLVELISVAAKHTAFQASNRLGASKIRLDEDLTPQQLKQRRGPLHRLPVPEGQGLQTLLQRPNFEVQGWCTDSQVC